MKKETTMKKRGRPAKNITATTPVHVQIDFSQITKLKNLNIDERMFDQMESGLILDNLISHEGGIPSTTNLMLFGDPGTGKTTLLLDLMASVQLNNPERRCLFISGEMGKKQMFKYTQRFPQFGAVDTLFVSDYTDHNTKDVIEQVLDMGWDLVLIDSVAEVLEGVRNDNGWDRKVAESWLVDECVKNNKGENQINKFSTFMLIQQVTKGGVFVGSNKMKHMVDAAAEIRREKESSGGGTYIMFNKNRNGMVDIKLYFQLTGTRIVYSNIEAQVEEEGDAE
jgi:KaiC/GvpD/RAD55 family RecA-like ATPase